MKRLKILAIGIIIFSLFTGSANGQYTKWHRDTVFQGLEFSKIKFIKDYRFSVYAVGILKRPTVVEGLSCHKKIVLTKSGKLITCILSQDYELLENEFNKNTQITHRSDGSWLIYCPYQPTVQGYKIERTPYRSPFFVGSSNFQLYPNGKLKYFLPARDTLIQGVWCKPSGPRGGVILFENGDLKQCTSAKDQVINGQQVGKNFSLKFNKAGFMYYAQKERIFGEK